MSNKPLVAEKIKKRLRGTIIHKIYALLKYDLYIIFVFKLYHNARRNNSRKINHFLKRKIQGLFRELPKSVAIDIVSCCNLRCPLCSVPPFITRKSENFMSFEDFKIIADALDLTTDLSLVYAGEPFLNPQIFNMIRYCEGKYFTTTITNGTLLNEKNLERLFDSGLDFLQISFDGFSKESFEKYRVGADFEKIKHNITNLLKKRDEQHRGLPHVTITYLINAYNENEVTECELFFRRAGAERFFAKAINLNTHRRTDGKQEDDLSHWLPKNHKTTLYEQQGDRIAIKEKEEACSICLTPIIKCDGEILLCCHDIFNTVKIGNVFEKNFKALWLSPEYRKIRNLAKNRRLSICQKCGK
ncbi:MAG: radical SAM protein [Deltaproteobacteria bacterium]|nr:radical SAM protein [Deltaproteobacteria bacterium]